MARAIVSGVMATVLAAVCFLFGVQTGRADDSPPGAPRPRQGGAPPMRKYVSKHAHFVVYVPAGWTVNEGVSPAAWSLAVQDPASGSRTVIFHGRSPVGNNVRRLGGGLLQDLRGKQGSSFDETRVSPAGDRLYVRGRFTRARGKAMEFRSWTHVRSGDFSFTRVEVPRGQYEARKSVMLSPMVNLVPIPGRFGRVSAQPLPLWQYRLPNGAGTCLVPRGWKATHLGKHYMMAADPQGKYGFFSGYDEAVTPRSRIRSPYVATSSYRSPAQALAFFIQHKRLATNVRIVKAERLHDLTRGLMTLYRGGRAEAEAITFTCTAKGRRIRGFSIGMTGMTTLGMNWGLVALTVTAPEAEFPVMAATFEKMMASYRVNDQYARAYVEAGRRRVQQMVAQTIQIVQRNRAEIQQMMAAAYRERQLSQDYISYQRARYIRGESDWVSAREGGAVYRSDRWGLRNQTTGGRLDGQPFNYFNFRGGGGYGGLREINSRELWQQAYGR